MKSYNILHIVVDAVRYYDSGKDERDRLPVFDKYSYVDSGFVTFEKMVVSAPSTLMSAITMLTGLPSFFLARNYNDFEVEPECYSIFTDVLKENGYRYDAVLNAEAIRDKCKSFFPLPAKKYLPKGVSLSQSKWSNEEVTQISQSMLADFAKSDDPFYLMAWYNSRFDLNTSQHVEAFIDEFRQDPRYDDTLIILTADHGYPDQSRGFTSDGCDLKKVGLAHDLILTDDNICVPFCIKLPKAMDPGLSDDDVKVLSSYVVPQTMIYPTMMSAVAPKQQPRKPLEPKDIDFVTFFKTRELAEHVRSDARFVFQPKRIVALRSAKYKYIYEYGTGETSFYNLVKDPLEEVNCIDDTAYATEIDTFKSVLKSEEDEALSFWFQEVGKSIEALSEVKTVNSVIYLGRTLFIVPVWKQLCLLNKDAVLYVLPEVKSVLEPFLEGVDMRVINFEASYSNTIIVDEDCFDPTLNAHLKNLNVEKYVLVDIHLRPFYDKDAIWKRAKRDAVVQVFKNMYYKKELYAREPMRLVRDLLYIARRSVSFVFSKV